MLKAHEDLLAQIELAEEAARGIYAKGARVDNIVVGLRRTGNEVKERIAHYKRDAKKAKADKPTPAAPPTGEPAQQQQQSPPPEYPKRD